MKTWAFILTIYMSSCILAVKTQDQTVFSVVLDIKGTKTVYNFNNTMFDRFYHCLRNNNYVTCDAQISNTDSASTSTTDSAVISVKGCLSATYGNTLTCTHLASGIDCTRGTTGYVSCPTSDYRDIQIDTAVNLNGQAELTWDNVNGVEIICKASHIYIIKPSQTNTLKFVIKGTFTPTFSTTTAKPTTAKPTTTKPTTKTKTASAITITTTTAATTTAIALTENPPDSNSYSSSQSVSIASLTTTVTSSNGPVTTTPSLKGDTHEDKSDAGDDLLLIIGAAVGSAVVIAVIVIIVVVVWRSKKKSSFFASTNNNQNDDTDIYPYGDSSMSNARPNLSFNNPAFIPTDSTPDTYATVDPTKKTNKTKTASDTSKVSNDNEKKPKQKKTRFSSNLDYIDVDITNANGPSPYQRSSDSNDDQGISTSETPPPVPPDPYAKPNDHNVNSETGDEPSATYTQVLKKNQTKDGKEAGSSPAPDPSGYEEAVPGTDTQYTTVMDSSAKNTPSTAPDGVYAKLHDPVRNITDVYNEWNATENATE